MGPSLSVPAKPPSDPTVEVEEVEEEEATRNIDESYNHRVNQSDPAAQGMSPPSLTDDGAGDGSQDGDGDVDVDVCGWHLTNSGQNKSKCSAIRRPLCCLSKSNSEDKLIGQAITSAETIPQSSQGLGGNRGTEDCQQGRQESSCHRPHTSQIFKEATTCRNKAFSHQGSVKVKFDFIIIMFIIVTNLVHLTVNTISNFREL